MPEREPRKKVAVLYNNGLHAIVGEFDPTVHTMREFIEFDRLHGNGKVEHIEASLFKVQPRFILYRQTMVSKAKGKLGEFHPQQK